MPRLFPCLALVEHAALNTPLQASVRRQVSVSLGNTEEWDGWAAGTLCFTVGETARQALTVAASLHIRTGSVGGFQFLHIFATLVDHIRLFIAATLFSKASYAQGSSTRKCSRIGSVTYACRA